MSTSSGQCPECRSTLAIEQAWLDAAPDAEDSTVECECGAMLTASSWTSEEIESWCKECGTEYVVNAAGAGAQLPCRCGAIITIPSVQLAVARPQAAQSQVASQPQVVEQQLSAALSPAAAETPISEGLAVQAPPNPMEVPTEVIAPSIGRAVQQVAVNLPIVAVPETYGIEPPVEPAVLPLPIVGLPETYSIETPVRRPKIELPIAAIEANSDNVMRPSGAMGRGSFSRLVSVGGSNGFRLTINQSGNDFDHVAAAND
ncbi:hypothetical protein C2E31_21405 [Rhodopirellula baltica]|nr:hypothetical protein C2E31_21405 [Rhodopirellula baltica]